VSRSASLSPNLARSSGSFFNMVQKYEKGVNRVGASRLQQIAEALGCRPDVFYEGNSKGSVRSTACSLSIAVQPRLLRAYTAVENQAVQRQFVSLVESIVASQDKQTPRPVQHAAVRSWAMPARFTGLLLGSIHWCRGHRLQSSYGDAAKRLSRGGRRRAL